MNDISFKLKEYFSGIGLTQKIIAETLGVAQSHVSAMLNGKPFGKKTAYRWAELFHLSPNWLLTGEGNMLQEGAHEIVYETRPEYRKPSPKGKIPFYDIADILTKNPDSGISFPKAKKMIDIGEILSDSELAIRVYNDSMKPTYPAGCIIGLKKNLEHFIDPGSTYVLETKNGLYIKRINYNKDHSAFICHSDNPEKFTEGPRKGKYLYPHFEIPVSEIKQIFIIIGTITRTYNG